MNYCSLEGGCIGRGRIVLWMFRSGHSFLYHLFLCSSRDTPPGPWETTMSKPPMTDVVWKKSYFKKSLIGLWDGIVHQQLNHTLSVDNHRTRARAHSFVLNPMKTQTMRAPAMTFWRIAPKDASNSQNGEEHEPDKDTSCELQVSFRPILSQGRNAGKQRLPFLEWLSQEEQKSSNEWQVPEQKCSIP